MGKNKVITIFVTVLASCECLYADEAPVFPVFFLCKAGSPTPDAGTYEMCLDKYSASVTQAAKSMIPGCDGSSVCVQDLSKFPLMLTRDASLSLVGNISPDPGTDAKIVKSVYSEASASGNCYANQDMKAQLNSCSEAFLSLYDSNDKIKGNGVCEQKQNTGDLLAMGSQLIVGVAAAVIPQQGPLWTCLSQVAGSYKMYNDASKTNSDCKDAFNSCLASCDASSYESKFKSDSNIKNLSNSFPAFDRSAQTAYLNREACVKQLNTRNQLCTKIETNVKAGQVSVELQLNAYSSAFFSCDSAINSLCGSPSTVADPNSPCGAAKMTLASFPNPKSINAGSICASGSTNCNSGTNASSQGFNPGGSATPTPPPPNGPDGAFGNGPAEAAHIPVPPADKSAAAGLALGTGSSGGGPFGGGNGGGNPGAKAAAQQGGGAAPPTPAAKLGFIGSSSSTSSSAGSGYNSTTAAAKNGERAVFGSKIAGDRSPSSESLANAEGDVFYHASKQYYNEALAKRVYSDGTVSGP